MTGLLAFLLLIGVLITVHEFGHYVVAKAFNVKVEAFSVGFGSPILQFKWGETEYKLCWIPLGGYVRMLGQMDYEMEQEKPPTPKPEDIGRSVTEQKPLVRILIYAAGPAMNLILPFFILMPFIALSDNYAEVPDNTIGAVDSSMPAGKAGLEPGDKLVEIDGKPVELFWQVRQAIGGYEETKGPLKVKVQRAADAQVETLSINPFPIKLTHPFLGYEITRYQIGYQPASLDASIGFLNQNNILTNAGLKTGDRILKVNNQIIKSMVDFKQALQNLKPDTNLVIEADRVGAPIDTRFTFLRELTPVRVQLKINNPIDPKALGLVHSSICVEAVADNGPVSKILKKDDCIVAVNGIRHSLGGYIQRALKTHPDESKTLTFVRNGVEYTESFMPEPYILEDAMAGAVPLHSIGFTLPQQTFLPPNMVPAKDRWAHGWYESMSRIPKEIEDTLRTIGGMVSGGVSPTQLSGPLTMYHLADSSVKAGLESYLNLMILLSLSIGLFNLLPIPLLDGGQILLASVEWITRRPIHPQLQSGLQYVGLFLILALLIFALGNDAVRTWRLTIG